jgi:hypothetical protein
MSLYPCFHSKEYTDNSKFPLQALTVTIVKYYDHGNQSAVWSLP